MKFGVVTRAVVLLAGLVSLILVACAPAAEPTAAPRPRATPAPTYTPIPTFTPVPGTPTPVPAGVVLPTAVPPRAPAAPARPTPDGSVTILTQFGPENWDVSGRGLGGIDGETYAMSMFDRLVDLDDVTMQPIPGLAVSWTNPELNRWVFTLREGVVFHNGEKFNADDVVYSYKRYETDPQASRRPSGAGTSIKEVKKTGEIQVEFTTTAFAFNMFPKTQENFKIMEDKYYTTTSQEEALKRTVGSGPFKFVSWQRAEELVVEAYDKHWRGAPRLKRIVIKPVPEVSTRIAGLFTGQADIVYNLPPDQVARVARTKGVRALTAPGERRYWLAIRTDRVGDRRVREAMNLAVDRPVLTKGLFVGYAQPLRSGIHPLFGDPKLKPIPYDPAKAKSLVQQAGYKITEPLKLQYGTGRYLGIEQVSLVVAQSLKEVGIPADLKPLEVSVDGRYWFNRTNDSLFYMGWGHSFNLLSNYLFWSAGYQFNGTFWTENTEGGKAYDKLFNDSLQAADPAKREALVRQMEVEWLKEWPAIALFTIDFIIGANDSVKGLIARADQVIRLNDVYKE